MKLISLLHCIYMERLRYLLHEFMVLLCDLILLTQIVIHVNLIRIFVVSLKLHDQYPLKHEIVV